MKGFAHTLEAIIGSVLLLSSVTIMTSTLQETQESTGTLDTTVDPVVSEKLDELNNSDVEQEFQDLLPVGYRARSFMRETDTESIQLGGNEFVGTSDRAMSSEREDFSGKFSEAGFRSSQAAISYQNLSEDLVAYYRFDDNTGPIKEYSGRSNDGQNNGAERGKKGVFSTNSFNFSGGSATIKDTPRLKEAFSEAGFTMSFWIKPTPDTSTWDSFVTWRTKDANGDTHFARTATMGPHNESIYTRFSAETEGCAYAYANGFWARNSNMGFEPNQWNLYTVTYDGNTIKEYSNGAVAAQGSPGCELGDLDGNITINSLPRSQKIDEFRVYDRTLTESEVRQLYFTGNDGKFNGTYSETVELPYGDVPKKIQVDSNLPSDTSAELIAKGNSFTLSSGSNNYSLPPDTSKDFDVSFELSTQNDAPTVSPEISSFKVWVNDTATETRKISKIGDSLRIHVFSDENLFNASYKQVSIAENADSGYYTVRSSETDGYLKFFGSKGRFEIVNQSINGNPRLGDNINTYNFPKYKDSPVEVKVSVWN